MRLRSRLVITIMAVAAASLAGCRRETSSTAAPGTSGQASVSPQPTADPHPPIGILNTPGEGETVPNKSWCTGWALDDSGIFQITGIADSGELRPAKIGQPFPGVKEAHPNMPDNETAGFIFQIPDLPPGPHSMKVEVVAKDGRKLVLTRQFMVQ